MRRTRAPRIFYILAGVLSISAASRSSPSETFGDVPAIAGETNLSVIERQITGMTRDILKKASLRGGETIAVTSPNDESRWIVEGAITSAMKADAFTVYARKDTVASIVFAVTSSSVGVRYADMYTDGMFGARRMRREVFSEMTSIVTRSSTGEVLYSGSSREAYADSVAVDDLPIIESSAIPATKGSLPPEAGFDRFVEPFVIIGATAVAIYLLFHVRS